MKHWRSVFAWLVVSTLLFGGHFRAYLDPQVRYLKFVQNSDLVPLILALLILATICHLVSTVVSKCDNLGKRFAETAFVIAFAQGLLVSLRPPAGSSSSLAPLMTAIAWCVVAVLLYAHWRRPQLGIAGRLAEVSLLLTPLPIILAIQFITAPSIPTQSKFAAWSQPNDTGSPIVIVIFDSWSFGRTFTNNAAPDWLPRLQGLTLQSTFYENARSPGPVTVVSMPGLLFQTSGVTLRQENLLNPAPNPSLLDQAPDGYQKAIVGFHLPYLSMLSGRVDSCQSYPASPSGANLASRIGYHFMDALIYWQDPWIEALRSRWYLPSRDKPAGTFGAYWHLLGVDTARAARRVVETMPPDTIALFHFPFPHPPMVFSADGSLRSIGLHDMSDLDGYNLNLLQLDRTCGELIDILESRSLWDSTLFVISSDHNWHEDLMREGRKIDGFDDIVRHVPLIVKFPGQTESAIDTNRFEMTELSKLFSRMGLPSSWSHGK